MIKLSFVIGRDIFNIYVDGEEVWYADRKWDKGIRCVPKDKDFIKKVKESRNKMPAFLVDLFNLTQAEKKEYEEAKESEEKLAEIVIKDCKRLGAKMLSKEIA